MSKEWWERVPKSNRDTQLANMGEGKYLGILRTAALRQAHIENKDELQQSTMAKALKTKPGNLRDMEAGHRAAPLAVCKHYCEKMGLPITILQRVGKGKLIWDGDTPKDKPPPELKPPPKKRARRELSEDEKERGRQQRAQQRVMNGAATSVDMEKAAGLKLRNHIEYNLVVVVSQTDKGNLIIDIFDEGADTKPSELLKNGFTGVRIPLPQVVTYDFDQKKKVHETHVPTSDS